MNDIIQSIALYAIPVIFAITLHEAAHGYVARMFGDPTAYQMGRVSLNPLRHIDLIGTLLVPLAILLAYKFLGTPGILFGWAKPVPVNFSRLRRPKQDMLWVAAAGPISNLVQAICWGIFLKLIYQGGGNENFWFGMAVIGVQINLILMALNLLPLLPLDGGRMLYSLLPQRLADYYARIEPYGLVVVLLLLFSGALWVLLRPIFALGSRVVGWFL
jgi:Zn-dependent protease